MNSSKKGANGIYSLNTINDAIIQGQYPGSLQDVAEGDPVVEFLLKFEESNGSRTYYNSVNKRRWFQTSRAVSKIGITGDGSIVNTRSKFGSSCYGNNNASDSPIFRNNDMVFMNGEPIHIGDKNFTIEGWIYITTLSGNSGSIFRISPQDKITNSNNTGDFDYIDLFFLNNGKVKLSIKSIYSSISIISSESSSALNTNVWQHIALVKQNNIYRVFLDGINILNLVPNTFVSSAAEQFINGNIRTVLKTSLIPYVNVGLFSNIIVSNSFFGDEVMFTNNIAKYTSNFTPPTTEFASEPTPSILFYNNFENEILDIVGGGQKDLTERNEYLFSNTTVTSSDKKFGSSSLYLSNSHQQILMDPKSITGDFNISVWIKPSVVSECPIFHINSAFFNQYGGGFTSNLISYLRVGGGTYSNKSGSFNPNNGSVAFTIGNTTIRSANNLVSTNTWHHIHVSRNNNTLRLFLNGNQIATGSSSSPLASTNNIMVIGFSPRWGLNEAFNNMTSWSTIYRSTNININSIGLQVPIFYSGYIDEFIIDNKPGLTSVTVPTTQLSYILNS
jgi:hypothetical protein